MSHNQSTPGPVINVTTVMKNMHLRPNLQNVSIAKDLFQLSPNNVPIINKNKKSSHSNIH